MKNILPALLVVLLALGIGAWLMHNYYQSKVPVVETQATVLLEKVRKVCKLVTVEGDFSERYNEVNIRPITLYLPFSPTFTFPKEASMLLTGKVLVGYNMEKVNIKMDSENQTVVISNLPEPEILAIDHDIKFENLEESYFNSFTKEDYTQLGKNAKEELRKRTMEGKLIGEAKEQGNHLFEIIEIVVENAGWTLEIQDAPKSKKELIQ